MKCPGCKFVCSDLRDLCPKCLLDLRPAKKVMQLPIADPDISYGELLQGTIKKSPKPKKKKKKDEKLEATSFLKKFFPSSKKKKPKPAKEKPAEIPSPTPGGPTPEVLDFSSAESNMSDILDQMIGDEQISIEAVAEENNKEEQEFEFTLELSTDDIIDDEEKIEEEVEQFKEESDEKEIQIEAAEEKVDSEDNLVTTEEQEKIEESEQVAEEPKDSFTSEKGAKIDSEVIEAITAYKKVIGLKSILAEKFRGISDGIPEPVSLEELCLLKPTELTPLDGRGLDFGELDTKPENRISALFRTISQKVTSPQEKFELKGELDSRLDLDAQLEEDTDEDRENSLSGEQPEEPIAEQPQEKKEGLLSFLLGRKKIKLPELDQETEAETNEKTAEVTVETSPEEIAVDTDIEEPEEANETAFEESKMETLSRAEKKDTVASPLAELSTERVETDEDRENSLSGEQPEEPIAEQPQEKKEGLLSFLLGKKKIKLPELNQETEAETNEKTAEAPVEISSEEISVATDIEEPEETSEPAFKEPKVETLPVADERDKDATTRTRSDDINEELDTESITADDELPEDAATIAERAEEEMSAIERAFNQISTNFPESASQGEIDLTPSSEITPLDYESSSDEEEELVEEEEDIEEREESGSSDEPVEEQHDTADDSDQAVKEPIEPEEPEPIIESTEEEDNQAKDQPSEEEPDDDGEDIDIPDSTPPATIVDETGSKQAPSISSQEIRAIRFNDLKQVKQSFNKNEVRELLNQAIASTSISEIGSEFELTFEQFQDLGSREDIRVNFHLAQLALEDLELDDKFDDAINLSKDKMIKSSLLENQLMKASHSVSKKATKLKSSDSVKTKHSILADTSKAPTHLTLASLPLRLAAFVLDALFILLVSLVSSLIYMQFIEQGFARKVVLDESISFVDLISFWTFFAIAFIAWLLAFPLICLTKLKSLPGQFLAGIEIRNENGLEIGLSNAVVRALSFPISLLCLGPLFTLMGRRPLHETMSFTITCLKPKRRARKRRKGKSRRR